LFESQERAIDSLRVWTRLFAPTPTVAKVNEAVPVVAAASSRVVNAAVATTAER